MEVKETLGDGGGRNYDNRQFSNQNRHGVISRVSVVQNLRWEHWWSRLNHKVTSPVHAAKGWQWRWATVAHHWATVAHHSIWRHLYDSMHAAQKLKSKPKFVTLHKKSNMSMLCRREEFLRICTKEALPEKAQDIDMTIPVKKSQETRYIFDPAAFFVNRFCARPPQSPEDRHINCILLIRIVFCHVSTNLSIHCLYYVTMNIYFYFYFDIAGDIVTVLMTFQFISSYIEKSSFQTGGISIDCWAAFLPATKGPCLDDFSLNELTCTVFGKPQILCALLYWPWQCPKKTKRASRSFFVGLSTTNLKMIWKQVTNKQM